MSGGPYGKRLNGEGRRLAASGAGKDAGIGDDQVPPSMAAAVRVDNRSFRVIAYAASPEDMGRLEGIVNAVLLEKVAGAGSIYNLPRLFLL